MILCVIPARYASTRLPAKPLARVGNKPLVMWVYDAAADSGAFDAVLVATDDERIADTVSRCGGIAVLTSAKHQRGTDRVWEAARDRREQFIVNLQGDEPEVPPALLRSFARELVKRVDDNAMLTCVSPMPAAQATNPNTVKVVLNSRQEALYFSRAAIPYNPGATCTKHTGIYGFSRAGLERFCLWPPGVLEQAEELEQLRALEHGMIIHCLSHRHEYRGIDTPEDLKAFRQRAPHLRPTRE